MRAAALLLADARTPSGTYAHSAGLEAAVAAGLGLDGVPAFIRARLRTVAAAEAALTAAAVTASSAAAPAVSLAALDAEALARCPSPALRQASTTLGRAVLRTGASLFAGDATIGAYRAASAHTPRPVAFGVVAAAGGLDPETAALIALHDDAATVAAAAVKLLPVDAARTSGWLADLGPELERAAAEAARHAAAGELPSPAAPLLDRRSLVHHRDTRRLFAS